MSNRDGRDAKPRHNKVMYNIGKVCPRCSKGKLEKADCCHKKGHEYHVICKTCNFSNF